MESHSDRKEIRPHVSYDVVHVQSVLYYSAILSRRHTHTITPSIALVQKCWSPPYYRHTIDYNTLSKNVEVLPTMDTPYITTHLSKNVEVLFIGVYWWKTTTNNCFFLYRGASYGVWIANATPSCHTTNAARHYSCFCHPLAFNEIPTTRTHKRSKNPWFDNNEK